MYAAQAKGENYRLNALNFWSRLKNIKITMISQGKFHILLDLVPNNPIIYQVIHHRP